MDRFINNNLEIQNDDLLSKEEVSVENFLTKVQSASLWVEKQVEPDYIYQCDRGCMMGVNEKLKYRIRYNDKKSGKSCERDILVKMRSSYFDEVGFKSKVKTINKPSCLSFWIL